jgi:hypothetical protein
MAPGWFGRWRLRAAIRKYAGRFGTTLLHDYGASDFYTAGQIEHTAKKLGLPRGYLCVMQAGFLPEGKFNRLNPFCRLGSYTELRDLLLEHCSWIPASASFEPLPVSNYISAGNSIR